MMFRRLVHLVRNSQKSLHVLERQVKCQRWTQEASLSSKAVANVGICIDIDGVLARGNDVLPNAAEAVKRLEGKVPLAFVTNALSRDAYKAYHLGSMLGIKVLSSQMVQAQGPLALYPDFHNKRCLLVGQGPLGGIAEDIGFNKTQWMEDVGLAYPLLNVVDHQKRYEVSSGDIKEFELPKIEAIILLGEPKQWEMCLQLVLDLLLTDGLPSHNSQRHAHQTLPVIVCNTDLQFMHKAAFPRFGHGAFVLCLEALFKKVTGQDLQYHAVLGKPSEVTFRYAEHCLAQEARRMTSGSAQSLHTMYMIGDNIDVDIVGANLYQKYIDAYHNNSHNGDDNDNTTSYTIPACRRPPEATKDILPATVEKVHSVLVRTGVSTDSIDNVDQCHREFSGLDQKLRTPTAVTDDILQAVEFIMLEEDIV